MKLDSKTIYAQSSDIRSRTYFEYRKDMKKKAIAELEVLEWLESKVKQKNPGKQVKVYKAGGDKFLWFLRKGGISREADFIAEIENEKIEYEFQYAEKENLKFYDFKKSKVVKGRGNKIEPLKNKLFVYIHKPSLKYAILTPEWIYNNGELKMVDAWRSYAYRVPKEKFESLLEDDSSLKDVCHRIDVKTFILNFQHELINKFKDNLSELLQTVIDENKIIEIIPENLDSFFKVCFILNSINKIPEKANKWFTYILTCVSDNISLEDISLEDISKILYSIDFLYFNIDINQSELAQLIDTIEKLIRIINRFYQNDGSYKSSPYSNPLEETRYALFSINLLEDLIQDMIYYYKVEEFKPIKKIYENVKDIEKTYNFLKSKVK